MTNNSQEKINLDLRKKISIELCQSFTQRLDPNQTACVKSGAVIALKNFIKKSKIEDPIIYSFLVDTIVDPEKEVRDLVIKVIKEVVNSEIIELLEIKQKEISGEMKAEIGNLLKVLRTKEKN